MTPACTLAAIIANGELTHDAARELVIVVTGAEKALCELVALIG